MEEMLPPERIYQSCRCFDYSCFLVWRVVIDLVGIHAGRSAGDSCGNDFLKKGIRKEFKTTLSNEQ